MNYIYLMANNDFCTEFTQVFTIVGIVIFLIKVLVPLLLIVFSSYNLIQAIMASKEQDVVGVKDKLKRNVIAAVVVFLVIQITSIAVGTIAEDKSWSDCAKCAFHPFTGEGCGLKKVHQESTSNASTGRYSGSGGSSDSGKTNYGGFDPSDITSCDIIEYGENGTIAKYKCVNGTATISTCSVVYDGKMINCYGGSQEQAPTYLCTLSKSNKVSISEVCDASKEGYTYGGGLSATKTCSCKNGNGSVSAQSCIKTITGENGTTATYACVNGVGTIGSCQVNYNGETIKCLGGSEEQAPTYLCTLSKSNRAYISDVCDASKTGTTYGGGLSKTITCTCDSSELQNDGSTKSGGKEKTEIENSFN